MVDFSYIGPSRAGSTWFFATMNQHPEILFPDGKITHFWDEHYKGGHVYGRKFEERSVDWYLQKFKPVPGKKVGDVTESYAVMDLDKIYDFYYFCPNTKLIYCLRNPMDIAWSACRFIAPRYLGNLEKASLDKITDYLAGRWDMCSTQAYEYKNCDPVGNMKKWLSVFPENQFYTYYFENIFQKPKSLLKNISVYLEISENFWDGIEEEKLKQEMNKGKQIKLREDVKQKIVELFMPKVEELEDYTGENLQSWKDKWVSLN